MARYEGDLMPARNYTSPGSYSDRLPFATRNVLIRCVGGGASGYRDCDGDEEGGGGGGGGFAQSSFVRNGSGFSYTVGVANGGGSPGCDSGQNGTASRLNGGGYNVRATGGRTGNDDSGGGGGGAGSDGQILRSGARGDDDDNGQDGGSAGALNRSGGTGGCGGGNGGAGTNINSGNIGGCPGGRSGRNFGGGGAGNDGGGAGSGGNGAARIEWDYYPPQIFSFTSTTQFSNTGTPSSTVTLSWSTNFASSLSINQGIGSVTNPAGTRNVNTGLQSTAPSSNSLSNPATRTYTLTATGPGGTTTASVVANVYNDNNPSSITVGNSAFPGNISRTAGALEPLTNYYSAVTYTGVDMNTFAFGNSNCRVSNSPSGGWTTGSILVPRGSTFYVRYRSPDFNPSTVPGGTTGGETVGQTNTQTYSFQFGTDTKSFTATTRRPVIEETFDAEGSSPSPDELPFPDIDILPSPNPKEFIKSNQINLNDIEIDVEIKTSDGDAQVQRNFSGIWQDMREI